MRSYGLSAFAVVGVAALLFVAVRFGGLTSLSTLTQNTQSSSIDEVRHSYLIAEQAPFFDLPDIMGNHARISDFIETPLVVVFWSTWNDAAADQIHILDQYLSRQGTQSLVKIIAIDSQEERSVVSSFMSRGGYNVPTLIDISGSVSEAYHIKSLPTTYFIGRDGTIRDAYTGVLSESMLINKLDQIVQ